MINSGKNNINYTQLTEPSYGLDRRIKLALESFVGQGYIPKTISLKDIDAAFNEWVETALECSYDGNLLSTHFLLSSQRLSEFSKMWKINDSEGGLLLNFKTISRELNPQQGTQQGVGGFNIPQDNQYWPVGYIPVIENGIESVDRIEMKQPMCVDLNYTVSIFSTKLDNINNFATIVLNRFKSLEDYIRVQGQFMSMELKSITDESKYDLEARRFYSQSYKILVKGYLLKEDDFRRVRLQTRTLIALDTERKYKPCVTIEEDDKCEGIDLRVSFAIGSKPTAKFRLDEDMLVRSVETTNVSWFSLKRDDEEFDVYTCPYFHLYVHERLSIKIKKEDDRYESCILFRGQHSSCQNPPFINNPDSTWIDDQSKQQRRLDCVFPKFVHGTWRPAWPQLPGIPEPTIDGDECIDKQPDGTCLDMRDAMYLIRFYTNAQTDLDLDTCAEYYDVNMCRLWGIDRDVYNLFCTNGIHKFKQNFDEIYKIYLNRIAILHPTIRYIKFNIQCEWKELRWQIYRVINDRTPCQTYTDPGCVWKDEYNEISQQDRLELLYEITEYFDRLEPGKLTLERLNSSNIWKVQFKPGFEDQIPNIL